MAKITKIYNDANDKYATVILYANNSNELFYDEAFTEAVPAADMFHLFVAGVVALKGDVYYKPVSCSAAGVIDFGLTA